MFSQVCWISVHQLSLQTKADGSCLKIKIKGLIRDLLMFADESPNQEAHWHPPEKQAQGAHPYKHTSSRSGCWRTVLLQMALLIWRTWNWEYPSAALGLNGALGFQSCKPHLPMGWANLAQADLAHAKHSAMCLHKLAPLRISTASALPSLHVNQA